METGPSCTLLFKAGDKKAVNNYRPISLLPAIVKILEKLIHKQLYCFLDETHFFTDRQYGFRPKLSTTDSIDRILEYTYKNLNNLR